MGFAEIVSHSDQDPLIGAELSAFLKKRHALSLRPSITRRWLTADLTVWQEPRVTVGMIILAWWKEHRHEYIKPEPLLS